MLDQRCGRRIADEIGRELLRDPHCGGRLPAQDVERLVNLGEATALDRVTEKHLVAVVMPCRVELERAFAEQLRLLLRLQFRILAFEVDADAGQNPRQFLDVGLGVAGADAHGVQFHDLARVVLVEMAGGVIGIVEIAQHRRMTQRRRQQVAEAPHRKRPDRAILVVADHDADVRLVEVHIEMVEPEPDHAFPQLVRCVQRPQNAARRRLPAAIVHGLLKGLLRRFLLFGVGKLIGRAALLVEGIGDIERQPVHVGHRLDLRLHRCRQGRLLFRMQLLVEPAVGSNSPEMFRRRWGDAPCQPVHQCKIGRLQFAGGRRRCGQHQRDAASANGNSE